MKLTHRTPLVGASAPTVSPAADPLALLDTSAVARILGLSERTIEGMRVRGGGPPFVKVSGRRVRYRRSDLEVWMQERVRFNTSEGK